MLDSRATGNFMTAKIAMENGFQLQLKKEPYPLFVVDGEAISSNNSMVTQETVPLTMVTLRGHIEQIQFDVINMENHAMILGMP